MSTADASLRHGCCDVVVVGASAGGVEALSGLASSLPPNLAAAVLVVLHVPETGKSHLPAILSRRGPLPASQAIDGEPIRPAHIYIAAPGRQLILEPGRLRLTRGPRENGHRPSVDTLFRSAARAYGERVVGVVLSGTLDDGAAGMAFIKRYGGATVVQSPEEALYDEMPLHSLETGNVDFTLPVRDIGPLLAKMSSGRSLLEVKATVPRGNQYGDEEIEQQALDAQRHLGTPAVYTCPDCHGTLWEVDEGEVVRYRCRVGHAFSVENLLAGQGDNVENALWMALRALEERAQLSRQMYERAVARKLRLAAERYGATATEAEHNAAILRGILTTGKEDAPPAGEERQPA